MSPDACWVLRTGEGAAIAAGAAQLADVDFDEVFGPQFAEAVAIVVAKHRDQP